MAEASTSPASSRKARKAAGLDFHEIKKTLEVDKAEAVCEKAGYPAAASKHPMPS